MKAVLAIVLLLAGCDQVFSLRAPVDGPSDGETPITNLVFVTSSTHTGNLGGLSGADAICAARAAEARIPGTFVAYVSTTGNDAASRLSGSRGWRRFDGQPVTDSIAQLTTGRQWYPIAQDETGADRRIGSAAEVWTGTASDGTATSNVCEGWKSGTSTDLGTFGRIDSNGGNAVNHGRAACSDSRRLFCFEIGKDQQIDPPSPTAGRLAFISSSSWIPTSGRSSADAQCNAEATAANRGGSFLAALPLAGQFTATRFDTNGLPWVRIDGVQLSPTASGLFGDALLQTSVALQLDGQATENSYWAGNPTVIANAADTCSDWTATTQGAYVGLPDVTGRIVRWYDVRRGCTTSSRLLCLEQ